MRQAAQPAGKEHVAAGVVLGLAGLAPDPGQRRRGARHVELAGRVDLPELAQVHGRRVGVFDARIDVFHRQIGILRDQRQRQAAGRSTATR